MCQCVSFYFLCWAVELVLEKERESFWAATVEPVLQLKDELNFRASQLRQQKVTAESSDGEQVIEKVFVWYGVKTFESVCSWHQHWIACKMATCLNISRKTHILSHQLTPSPSTRNLSSALQVPKHSCSSNKSSNPLACSHSSLSLHTAVHWLPWISCLLDSHSPKVTDVAFDWTRLSASSEDEWQD